MASIPQSALQLPPLTKQHMSELVARAHRLGVQPADYAKNLIEDGLALQREAEEKSFAEIMAPVRRASGEVSDAEIVKLVATVRRDRVSSRRAKKR